jgi:phosphoserine aminotransferase
MTQSATLEIPQALKPADGRFGAGPSKVRPEQIRALAGDHGTAIMGTSHRQKPVRQVVGRIREGLRELFALPDGYEVALGNGGTTALWDALTFGLVRERALHLTYGEFSAKFASCTTKAPFLQDPVVDSAEPGDAPAPRLEPGCDIVAWAHNETSTGVMVPVQRPQGDGLVVVDATSAPAAFRSTPRRPTRTTSRRRSPSPPTAASGSPSSAPRRSSGSTRSPARALHPGLPEPRHGAGQLPQGPDLQHPRGGHAHPPRRADRLDERGGGLEGFAVARTRESSSHLYAWAEEHDLAEPFVADPAKRSLVIGTIDFAEEVDAAELAATLRANGIVDVEPYRKLGRNQLRIGMFPAVEPADVQALTACIDYVLEQI